MADRSDTDDTPAPPPASSGEPRDTLLHAVLDETPDVMLLKDADGNFLLCNRTVARLYGTTPEAMVGKHDDDFGVPREMADGFRANVLGIMASGRTEIVFEDSRDAVTGEVRHFKSIKRPFKDAQGRNQILVIAHDITDVVHAQRQVAQSEFTLQQVMKATQDGIWDWHVPSGKLAHNERWFGILGFDANEVENHVDAFSRQLHPDDRAQVWARIERLVAGTDEHYRSEHRMLRKDGSVIWVLDRGRAVERDAQGRALRVVGAYTDISERRRDQAALEQALTMAQAATSAKSEFLATMSHELRTPMNGILGMAQLLTQPTLSEAKRIDYARIILGSGETLLALLNDILDLSRVEAGRMDLNLTSFEPSALVSQALQPFRETALRKGLTLHVEEAGMPRGSFVGDPLRLQQMLANYLSNALKFTPAGRVNVAVTERCDAGASPTLEFSVEDTGVGFADAQRHRLFQPFSQIDSSTTRAYGGSGLGLSIVARLARLMDGEVGASSSPGRGSRFWFRVPARRAAAVRPAVATRANASPGSALPGRVLVAEDNSINREVLRVLLENLRASAEFVADGSAALACISAARPGYDLVLMDLQMPVLDGLAATRHIRDWEREHDRARTPVVAVTASAFEEDRRRCLEAGMDDVLVKPITLERLEAMLAKWLHPA